MPNLLEKNPIHLGLGASAVIEPEFTDMTWYEGYAARHQADGTEGRLVSMYTFSGDWNHWEMHPNGHEVVVCVAGSLTLLQEIDGEEVATTLTNGEYAINEPGIWHTANVQEPCTALFITAGAGTEGRPR